MTATDFLGAMNPAAFLAAGQWDRPGLVAVLNAAAIAYGAEKTARSRIAPLARTDSFAVVTGQQPAVGGGPLYSLVKTAHAIAIARALGDQAVPLFWCASEDHDVSEANHADVVTRDGSIRRFTGDLGGGRASLRFRPTRLWWDALWAHCQEHLGNGLGSAWLKQQQPFDNESMGAWTCRLMIALFARYGLVCVEGHSLRPLWTATMQRALTNWPTTDLATLRQRLLAEGNQDSFGPLDQPPVFSDRTDGRTAVSIAEAQTLLISDPTALSPGAALRPILQQAALPALAYVGGPGELAYHRFIMPVYTALGVCAPRLIPRCSLTLVPSWVERGAERWQVTLDALTGQPPSASSTSAAVLAELDAALIAMAEHPAAKVEQRRINAGIIRLKRERDRLAASLERAHRQQLERPAWGALQGWLRPRGERQERTLSLFQALWEFGPGIADRLVDAAALSGPGMHGFVSLK
jgi:bacillithiol synthase